MCACVSQWQDDLCLLIFIDLSRTQTFIRADQRFVSHNMPLSYGASAEAP